MKIKLVKLFVFLLFVVAGTGAEAKRLNKVEICHKPGTSDQKVISVDERKVKRHLRHGDSLLLEDCEPQIEGPSALDYPNPQMIHVGDDIGTLVPSYQGQIESFTVQPEFPAGILIDEANGVITGAARESVAPGTYIVTGSGPNGSTTYSLDLQVITNLSPPVTFSYLGMHRDPATGQRILLSRYVWEGEHVVLMTESPDRNPGTIELLLSAFDKAYEYYVDATGREPRPLDDITYNGKLPIVEVPATCGAGCGYLGATGIEILNEESGFRYFDGLLDSLVQYGTYDTIVFYELGRNFWFYSNQIGAPSFTTGYAVLMRILSLENTGVPGADLLDIPYEEFVGEVIGMVDTYEADPQYTFENTLMIEKGVPAAVNLGGTDLFASFVLRLIRDYGDGEFVSRLWREVANRPMATSLQEQIDNFVTAASYAAGQNLTEQFETNWRWPVSTAVKQELKCHFPGSDCWTVIVNNTDDHARALVNGEEVLTCGFAQECELNITGLLQPGSNTLEIQFYNDGGGWTYGYEVLRNNEVYESGSCGTAAVIGCNNNESAPAGLTMSISIEISL